MNTEKEYTAKEGVRLSPPWIEYYNQLEALFGQDPDIKLEYSEDDYKVKMFVHGHDKAEALQKLIPAEKSWGGVKHTIIVVPLLISSVRLSKEIPCMIRQLSCILKEFPIHLDMFVSRRKYFSIGMTIWLILMEMLVRWLKM